MNSARSSLILAVGLLSAMAFPASGGIRIRTQELPWAALGGTYDAEIDIIPDSRCSCADMSISLAGGALPRGIELSGHRLHGIPREMGTFPITIRAANICQTSGMKELALVVTGKPILRVGPGELVFEYRTGGPDPEPQPVLVASTWPHLPYSVTSVRTEWLDFSVTEGFTPDRGGALSSDCVWVRVSPQKLPPGVYKASLAFSVWLGANTPVVPITLRVAPKP